MSKKEQVEIEKHSGELDVKTFFASLKQVASQNLLSIAEIKTIIEQAVLKSFHTKFDPDADLEMTIDEVKEEFRLVNKNKLVVSDEDYDKQFRPIEINLSSARKINPKVQVGETVSEEIDFPSYSKTIAQQIRQLITQSIKESKKGIIWERHKDLKGQMIDVTVTSITDSYAVFVLEDGTSAFMPAKLRNAKIPLKIGENVKVFVEDVLRESRDSQIVVSNGSTVMIRRLLELEIPEIADGTIEIVNVSRIAGERTKIAARSKNPNVDPVGAIIGAQGARINTIVSKLNGEKIDVILWSADLDKFVASALAPARVISVFDKLEVETVPGKNQKVAIVPDKHQTLAIGRGGSNVRLAVELVNCKIDVISYTEAINRGMTINWNGNITQDEMRKIDDGGRLGRQQRGDQYISQRTSNPAGNKTAWNNLFDEDISTFNEEIEMNNKNKPAKAPQFDVSDSIFSEEELKQMEANFEFDDEIATVTDLKDDE